MATHPCSASDGNSTPRGPASARIDVWLWSVRQIKSRSAATSACKAGHVRINGETAKPAQHVAVGDEVRYRVDGFDRLLTVTRILTKRVGAPIARTAYIRLLSPSPVSAGCAGRRHPRSRSGTAHEEGTTSARRPHGRRPPSGRPLLMFWG